MPLRHSARGSLTHDRVRCMIFTHPYPRQKFALAFSRTFLLYLVPPSSVPLTALKRELSPLYPFLQHTLTHFLEIGMFLDVRAKIELGLRKGV
jgi:hypothetical protein